MERPSGLRVSHEAIYATVDILPRGELRDMTNIKDRATEIEGRLVPGHWKRDLILGARGASAIGTLIKRTSRSVVLVHMPVCKADVATSAFAVALAGSRSHCARP